MEAFVDAILVNLSVKDNASKKGAYLHRLTPFQKMENDKYRLKLLVIACKIRKNLG